MRRVIRRAARVVSVASRAGAVLLRGVARAADTVVDITAEALDG